MPHERAEARLAAAPVDLLVEHRAVERERDLRRERARCRALGLGHGGVTATSSTAGLSAPRRERDDQRTRWPAGRPAAARLAAVSRSTAPSVAAAAASRSLSMIWPGATSQAA